MNNMAEIHLKSEKKCPTHGVHLRNTPIYVGKYKDGTTDANFIGIIDEITIYSELLSQNEIYQLMNNSTLNESYELELYWSMNEGSGELISDISGNNHNANWVGTPQWVESALSTSVDWLTLSETTLIIPLGEGAEIEITAIASGYELGDYEGSIHITTNDPENPSIEIPVTMSVQYPIANVEAESIEFGEVGFNGISNNEYRISNSGNYPLEVTSSFSVGYSEFDILNDSLTVQPGDTGIVEIQLSTELEEVDLADTLILSMNDPAVSSFLIPVSSTIVPGEHPIITSVTDVPNDQGGWVWVNFTRSYHDTDSLRDVEIYTVETNTGYGWTIANSGSAHGETTYQMLVHTTTDSSHNSDGLIDFRVIAAMEEGNFVSDIMQGWSVDNIVPDQPVLTGVSIDDELAVTLNWQPNQNEDFETFQIYRNEDLLQSTTDLSFTETLPLTESVEYAVFAMDVHGNLSEPALETVHYSSKSLPIGNTLLSLIGDVENTSVSDHLDDILADDVNVNFLIGQGVGLFNTCPDQNPGCWSGNLNDFDPESGYWINIGSAYTWNMFYEELKPVCETYSTAFGNNLLSYTWFDNAPTLDALGGEAYASEHFEFIIGQGVGLFNTGSGWSGNLNNLSRTNGYWVNISNTEDEFVWGFDQCAEEQEVSLSKTDPFQNIPEEYRFTQSTEQAFYLVKDIGEVEEGDLILAYCGDHLVGSVEWSGEYTPIPVMGKDLSLQTDGFCEIGDIPQFKLLETGNSQLVTLVASEGTAPGWSSLGVFMLESLTSHNVEIPSEFILHPAFPNPFNPVTTISFGVPSPSPVEERVGVRSENRDVMISIYDITGRRIESLIDGTMEPGYHTVKWNAGSLPSGVYFVKLNAGTFSQSQKLLLLK